MKIATMPELRVEPELREAVEAVLNENVSLSAFMEAALRDGVTRRRLQSHARAQADNDWIEADAAHVELQAMLDDAKRKQSPR